MFFLEERGAGLVLRAAPVQVGEILSARLYPECPTVVLTSATLR